ncbi:hypothetical protein F4604DRAFT_1920002 [Suillus subluteus]|nr:hypothetical protein F4604DRAFT_1920002 [Suillus subluteus]
MTSRKRKRLSTISHVRETRILDTGSSRTTKVSLTQVRRDRLAFEEEQHAASIRTFSHSYLYHSVLARMLAELTAKTRQLLAEAALEVGRASTGDPAVRFTDYGNWDDDNHLPNGADLDNDGETESNAGDQAPYSEVGAVGQDDPALSAMRAQVIIWQKKLSSLSASFPSPSQSRDARCVVQSNVRLGQLLSLVEARVGILSFCAVQTIHQAPDELANVSLIKAGFLGCSPQQPTTAIALECLELYHQIHRRKPSFSVQAMVKVLCALHKRTYFQSFRDQFAIAFDAYLDILHHVKAVVNQALGCDSLNWRMLNACPPCSYKQDNEAPLDPNGSGHADEHIFPSDYLIAPSEVELFKDDVRLCPGTRIPTDVAPSTTNDDSACTENWKTANTVSENTVSIFDQTGIFISACRHGIVQTLVEMRKSGELAKYALATTSKVLDVYGSNGATGYDIGCSYGKTVAASSISTKAGANRHRFLVNSFHGHAHNRQCQIQHHPLYQKGLGIEDLETCERIFSASNAVAPVIHHASYFHWLQFIELHFDQWDLDKYSELSKFIYNNYKQALHIVNELSPAVQELKVQLGLTDTDFERWNSEELEYLQTLAIETEEDIKKMTYIEALESLASAEAKYGSVTSVQFLSYSPTDFTPTQGLRKSVQTVAKAREAEHSAAYHRLVLEMNAVDDLERRMGITERWTREQDEYKHALNSLTNRRFIRVVEHLEGLVVKRLFELAKANLAGTGYKLRQHISNAIARRSAAIRTVLDKYNALAPLQNPPRPTLEYHETSCPSLGLPKPIARSLHTRLNVEVVRLHAWVDDEDAHLSSVARSLSETNPTLAYEIQCRFEERHRVNNIHRTRLEAIYDLPGYNGLIRVSEEGREGKDGDHVKRVLGDLEGSSIIHADEDDVLCDEANCLDACMSE